jgi:uncharacterized Ntn-hydrolase superfamily protein
MMSRMRMFSVNRRLARRLRPPIAGVVARTLGAGVLGLGSTAAAAEAPRLISTFSIVAYDSTNGDLGVAVQSKFFAVGSVVPWARAGVGAIASQAFGNTTFGPRGLDLLAQGKPPREVLQALVTGDEAAQRRQVGVVGAHGETANHTGTECLTWAGAKSGRHYTCQGNILAGPKVLDEMARAFERTQGLLGDRLLAALDAGQAAGGDSRGMQSAALLIVRDKGGYGGYNDRYCDLRVDDAPDPFRELHRLFDLWKPNALIREGYTACDAGDFERAYHLGREALAVDAKSGEPHYHLACFYSKAGRKEDALAELAKAVAQDPALGTRARTDTDFTPLLSDSRFKKLTGS